MKRSLAGPLLLAAVLFSGCTYHQRLGESFYQQPGSSEVQAFMQQQAMFGGASQPLAQMPAEPAPLRIGLVKGDAFKPLEGGHCMGWTGDPYVETQIEGDFEAGAVSALGTYFQSAVLVDAMDPKEKVDLFAKVDRSFPDGVGISFYDPKTKALLQDIREAFDADPGHIITEPCDPVLQTLSCLFWDTIAWDIMFPLWAKFAEDGDYKRSAKSLRARLSNTLSLISARAASSPVLVNRETETPSRSSGPPSREREPAEQAPSDGQKPWWQQQ